MQYCDCNYFTKLHPTSLTMIQLSIKIPIFVQKRKFIRKPAITKVENFLNSIFLLNQTFETVLTQNHQIRKYFTIQLLALSKIRLGTRPWSWEKMEPLKNGPVGRSRPQGLKILSYVSIHIKDKVEVIHFHIKRRGVQSLVFAKITFEKCTTNFYFQNDKVGIKTTTANL